MYRNETRIPILLDLIEMYWMQEGHTDLRFGQIVAMLKNELDVDELFNVEEDELIEVLCGMVNCNEV